MLRLSTQWQDPGDRSRGRSDGVTLIELVVVVAVMGIVLSGITALLLVSTSATQKAREQLNQDGGLRLASVYFNPDVQSADLVERGTANCGSNSEAVIVLSGTDYRQDLNSPIETTVSYVVTNGDANGKSLTRYACEDGELTDEVVVAEGLDSTVSAWAECRDTNGDEVQGCGAEASSVTLITNAQVPESEPPSVHRMTAARRSA